MSAVEEYRTALEYAAIAMGYRVLHFTGSQVRSGYAAREIAAALGVGA